MQVPQTGIEPVTFRLYVYITAERDIQLHHRGFDCEGLFGVLTDIITRDPKKENIKK